MSTRNRFARFALMLTLLATLCAGMFSPRAEGVEAKPNQIPATTIVISEFRSTGPGGGNDEFIELYNPTNLSIGLTGLKLRRSSGCGATLNDIYSFTSGSLLPGQHYLIAGLNYSGTVTPDISLPSNMSIADNGGVAITTAGNVPIDQVGMCSTTTYREGTSLADITTTSGQSYERKLGGTNDSCQDDTNNIIDFQPISPSTPQNISTPRRLCGVNADLRLSITTSNLSPIIGENVIFTLTVINYGVSTATNVAVRDNLISIPLADLSYFSDSSLGSYVPVTGVWTIGSLPSGASTTLTITVTNNSLNIKTYQAEVLTSDQIDPDSTPGNSSSNEDDDYSVKLGTSTLNITNVVNNPTPNIGANVVFTIIVNNPTGLPAPNVLVDALLPPGLEFISASSGSYVSSTGTWTIGPPLAPATSLSLSITARVMSATTMLFAAEVSSSDISFTNNSAIATVTPIPSTQADLRLTQSWTRSTSASDTALLNITVTNQDPVNAATNVQVRDLLPTGLTYVSHTSGMNYNSSTGIWAVGTVLSGAPNAITLAITVKVSPSGTSTDNFAEVWLSDQFDIDSTPGNGDVGEDDGESEEVLVADLSLTQTSDIAGTNAVFTIRITNSGPDDATNITVKNSKLSSSYSYVSHTASMGSYNSATGDWVVPTLANGATATLIVTTTVLVPEENLAEISAVIEVDPDSLPNNNSRTEDDDATSPSADLSLTQTIIAPAPYLNSDLNTNVTFRITVSNAGYANATGVEVKDLLPAGLTYVSHTSGQTYSSSSGIWTVGALNSGLSLSLDITAKVTTLGIRTNWAEVWKSTQSDPDSNPGDGSTIDDDDASQVITSYRAVVINEVAWSGTAASSEDEWIELYNPSDTEITVTGWQIRKNSCAGTVYITLNGKVSKDGYFLLERGDTSTDNTTVSDVSASQIYLATDVPALSDSGEILYLCDNFGNFIDTANGNGGSWPAGDASAFRSTMERQSSAAESDSIWSTNNGSAKNGLNANGGSIYGTPGKKNSVSSSSSSSSTATPEPTDTPTLPPPPVVVPPRPIINEILARPGFDWNQDGKADVFDEFIEIKNLTVVDISLSGWKLDTINGKKIFSLPEVTLKPGERIVYYSKETNLLLSDGGETVRLSNSSGKIYDAFTYTVSRVEDKSFCRLPDGNPGESWFEDCLPTPNLTNTREGQTPTSPDDNTSPVCNLPDTIPLDFFIPECNGYGAHIWNPFYWDLANWTDKLWIQQTNEKWRTFIE